MEANASIEPHCKDGAWTFGARCLSAERNAGRRFHDLRSTLVHLSASVMGANASAV
jgi:hypothetical protein